MWPITMYAVCRFHYCSNFHSGRGLRGFSASPYNYFVPGRVAKYCDEHVCLSVGLYVCLCVCLSVYTYLKNSMSKKSYQIFCACCLWLWFGRRLAGMQ